MRTVVNNYSANRERNSVPSVLPEVEIERQFRLDFYFSQRLVIIIEASVFEKPWRPSGWLNADYGLRR
jgi:hypothetical protein